MTTLIGRAARRRAPWILCVAALLGADGPSPSTPKRAVAPVAPVVPGPVVAAMQGGKYAEAVAGLDRLIASTKGATDRAYLALIRGTAQRLAGKSADARATWTAALKADPGGLWASKLRFGLAALDLADGRAAPAEELARAEAERLLAAGRKDRLAEVYRDFARRLLKPDDPITPPDPKGAYELLDRARILAKGPASVAVLRLEMARAAQAMGGDARAIVDFQEYLKDPTAPDRAEARYGLGESQFRLGMLPNARTTWTDLAADLAKQPDRDRPDADAIRAKALYRIATTQGVPSPPDDVRLELGVAALRRFLAAYPAHPWAVRASIQIGESYLARGQSDAALAAFRAFLKGEGYRAETDEARRDLASMSMTAAFRVAVVLQSQRKFDEAVAAFQGYLAKFPDGPMSADAQRAILATRLMAADEALRREKYAEARAGWSAFVAQNPLDARDPQVLFQIGASYVAEKKDDDAIAAWAPLISKFPGSEPASHAQFLIAGIFEDHKGDADQAIERYRKVAAEPWRSGAAGRIGVMESRELTVVTPRAFRSGETPHLKVTTRNLETLTFSAYKLNAEAYFRKKHAIGDVESLDIGLVAADAEWTVPVAKYAKYKPIETTYDLKVKGPGVWVVKVTDEKHLQATTLVVGSDLDAIVKSSREQLLVFAQDMKTGRGRAKARVLVSDGSGVVLEKSTGEDGVLLADWDKPRDPNASLSYLVVEGADVASIGLSVPGRVAQGLSARAYLYTDRPAYRPGQTVELRGVVREAKEGRYDDPAGATYRLEVLDARGRVLVARPTTLSAFGTFHETISLDASAPVGSYRVRLFQPGGSEFPGSFEVRSYRLEKVDVSIDLPKTVYFRGETIAADVVAKYQYGAPLADKPIEVDFNGGLRKTGRLDASGRFHVEFATGEFAEEQTLKIVARLPEENVGAVADVALATRALRIGLSTARDTYLDGESFAVKVATSDALGKPIGQPVTLAVVKRIARDGVVSERQDFEYSLLTDAKTGEVSAPVLIVDPDGGPYVLRAFAKDRFGNVVVSDRVLTISGKKDATKLRLLADRLTYKVGESARVNLHSRVPAGPALIAWEADRVIQYRVVDLNEGDNPLTWAVDGPEFPNFTLTAARMSPARFDEARLDLRVERDLRVTVAPKKPVVGPGEEVEVEVTTSDQLGRPVAAELSLALVDQSLLRLFADAMPPIGPFFYDQTRTGAFATRSTNLFSYNPTTRPVSEAVVEEAERLKALAENALSSDQIRRQAQHNMAYGFFLQGQQGQQGKSALDGPVTVNGAPMAPAPQGPVDVMGRMGGGMAGMGGGMGFGGAPGSPAAVAQGVVASADQFEGIQDYDRSSIVDGRGAGEAKGLHELSNRNSTLAMSRPERRLKRYGEGREEALQDKLDDLPPGEDLRKRFVETAYWNPAIVTGADGRATLRVKAPNAMSAYRFTARGVTGAETLVGQATADLVVRKDFFVDLKAPATLAEGDRPRFVGQVHHVGVPEGPATVALTVYAGGRQEVFPKAVMLRGDGVEEVVFDPVTVPDGDVVRLTLKAVAGDRSDELTEEVPIRPWGVQAFASASGASGDDATVFVGLPPGRAYENPDMLIRLAPSLRRMIVELALADPGPRPIFREDVGFYRPRPIPPVTVADRASELIAASAALTYLRAIRADQAPEARRLTDRVRGLTSELVTLQNHDGGWPWVAPNHSTGRAWPSDRMTSALAARALAAASSQALMTDPSASDRAVTYLAQESGRVPAADLEMRAMIAHALAAMHRGSFEAANALGRSRQSLPDAALAELALTFAALDRAGLADELLGVLSSRAKSEPVPLGARARTYWQGQNQRWNRGPAETTALVALAFARVRPQAPELAGAVEWLLAHRSGDGWQPDKARGPAVEALATYYGKAQAAEDRYRLIVTVNDAEVYNAEVVGSSEGSSVLVPRRALKLGDRNRVRFHIEGRGTFGYAVTLTGFARDFGPEQKWEGKTFTIHSRDYFHDAPELDGKTLPAGFNSVVNPTYFANKVTQVGLGGRAGVDIETGFLDHDNRSAWDRDFLVIEETLPAGTTLIEGSLESNAINWTLADGVLTLYFPPATHPGRIRYDVFGYVPGEYRAAPTRFRSAYNPGVQHLGPVGMLRVLAPGEASTDPYKPTPDELFARGKALFEAGRLAEAAGPLEALFGGYTPRDDVARDAARMLLTIHIKDYRPRKVVQDFEILKEKAPDLAIPFDEVLVVGRAYRDIGEHERAYLIWRAIVEASYLEDAQVGEALRRRGKTLDAVAFLLGLWRDYPDTASIEVDLFGLSQLLAVSAAKAIDDSTLRKELADAGVTRSELLLQAIRLDQVFLSLAPKGPMADEVSLALVGDFLELEDDEAVVRLASRFAALYPKSNFQDSFQYSEALGEFHLGHDDRAIAVADRITKATYKDANGVDRPSPNKWQATYILGQIHDARRQPAEAVAYYKLVADRFSDAAGAVAALTRKALALPEVTLVRPLAKPEGKPSVALDYRNIAEADVKVYPVDLMRLYLTRRNLDAIAGIDLAGITPLVETTVKLGDGLDFDDKVKSIDLPLEKEGAYLVMARGESLYASGIVLVSPLELQVVEEADAGRVRVTVRDARTKAPAAKVAVKVIGSENPAFISGRTDLRGVFVADGVRGQVTAVARRDAAQYAFHRGKAHVGASAPNSAAKPAAVPPGTNGTAPTGNASDLGQNIRFQCYSNSIQQIERLQERYKTNRIGVNPSEAR